MENSTTEIKFLGVTATKIGNKLKIDLYYKPPNSHQYYHVQHVTVMSIKNLLHTDRLQLFEIQKQLETN